MKNKNTACPRVWYVWITERDESFCCPKKKFKTGKTHRNTPSCHTWGTLKPCCVVVFAGLAGVLSAARALSPVSCSSPQQVSRSALRSCQPLSSRLLLIYITPPTAVRSGTAGNVARGSNKMKSGILENCLRTQAFVIINNFREPAVRFQIYKIVRHQF